MAAASVTTLYMSNGQTISVLIGASAAIGTIPTVNTEGLATTSNQTDFTVSSPCRIIDQINTSGPATAGTMEVYSVSRSMRSGRFIDQTTASFASTIATRAIPSIGFSPGTVYRFIQTVAQVS